MEDLELLDRDGKVVKTLHVDIVPDTFRNRFADAYKAIEQANKGEGTDVEKVERSRAAVIGFFEIIFGKAQTRELMEYYGDATAEAMMDILPFVFDVIQPQLEQAVSSEKERIDALMK